MVGSGDVVTNRDRRVVAQEYRTRVRNLLRNPLWVIDGNHQVFRRVAVRKFNALVHLLRHDDRASFRKRLFRHIGAIECLELLRDLILDTGDQRACGRDQQCTRKFVVLCL